MTKPNKDSTPDKNFQIKVSDLQGKKLMVATPMYGGQCSGIYCQSTNNLSIIAAAHKIDIRFYYLFNESLITRARNYCVDEFLRSDCTHLLFIDSDIAFQASDVFTLMYYTDSDKGMDIVTGPYPKKTIAWEKIAKAVKMGFADKNPFDLNNFVGDYVFNLETDVKEFNLGYPLEIKEGGTGFMCIDKKAFIKYDEAYPELRYMPDHIRTEHFDGTREITAFFDTVIEPESRRYLSEDYMFSHYARKIGLKVWLCPWIKLKHVGTYTFGGSLEAMGAIAASPTASKESNEKFYKAPTSDISILGFGDDNKPQNRAQRRAHKSNKKDKL